MKHHHRLSKDELKFLFYMFEGQAYLNPGQFDGRLLDNLRKEINA